MKKIERKTAIMWIGSNREILSKTKEKTESIGYAKAQIFFGSSVGKDVAELTTKLSEERNLEETLLLLVFERALQEICSEEHYAIIVGVDSRRAHEFMSFFDDDGMKRVQMYLRTGKMYGLDGTPCKPDRSVAMNRKILSRIFDMLNTRDIILKVQFERNVMASEAKNIVEARCREERERSAYDS